MNDKKGKRYLIISVAFFLLLTYSSFTFKDDGVSDSVLSQIQNYIDAENYIAIFSIANDPNFNEQISKYTCYEKGKISHLIGMAYYYDNQNQEAISYFKKVVFEDWKECPSTTKTEISNSIFNIGVCYQYTDQMLLGKPYIDSALVIIESIADYGKENLANKYQGAGSYYADIRDFTKSETYLKNASKLSKFIPQIDAYYIHIDLLSLYIKFKKYAKAEAIINQISREFINSKADLTKVDISIFYLNSAEVYLRQNDFIKAESTCIKALKMLPKEEINLKSNAHEILGVIYYKSKKYDKSKKQYELAYQLRLDENDIVQANISKSFSLENIAEVEMENGHYKKAISKVDEAISLNSIGLKLDSYNNPILNTFEISNGFHLLRQLNLKEKITYAEYQENKNITLLYQCLDIHLKIDTLVDNVLSNAFMDQSKLELIDNMANHSSRALDICIALYEIEHSQIFLEKAFYFSSRAKAILLQKLISNNDHLVNATDDKLKSKYLKLKDKLNVIQREIIENATNRDSLMKEFSSVQLAFEQFQIKVIDRSQDLETDKSNRVSIKDIQSKMMKDNLILDFFCGQDFLTVFALTKNDVIFKRIEQEKILPNIEKIKFSCLTPEKTYDSYSANILYQQLFSNITESVLENIKSVIIVPDGYIHGLPFEALINSHGQYLVEKWACSYSYVASMIFSNKKNKKYNHLFTGMGTTYSSSLKSNLLSKGIDEDNSNLANLSTAVDEIRLGNEIFHGRTFFNKDATVNNFYENALSSKIVYLSLHGVVDKEDGSRSFLIFDDRNNDFILRAYELHRQPMSADLLVLSACNTADGKLHSGEGVNSISRAFLASGVRSIISSIWSASEGSSLTILPDFLKRYKNGDNKIFALQEAKTHYLNNASPNLKHPFYWANYLLITDIEVHNGGIGRTRIRYTVIGVMVLFFFSFLIWKKNKK